MTETRAIPAKLRGKETVIPAGYVFENKTTAGIAGIKPKPYASGDMNFVWRVCAARVIDMLRFVWAGSYPRFPRRARVFMALGCGDRTRHHHYPPGDHRRRDPFGAPGRGWNDGTLGAAAAPKNRLMG